ncbi:MAG: cytochrome c3 family protein [Cyclobacteriaceae bacterium]|nr:cytochrome c3 family protein [Cyclobacteriaceae bacterium]
MKTYNKLVAFLFVFLLTQNSFSQTQGVSTMQGTAHDFNAAPATTWNTTGEMCVVCHTPHNSDVTVLDAPLWNHQVSTVGDYALYSSATFDGTALSQPDGSSKLCLSCHDGTVALENFGGVTTGTNFMPVARQMGDAGIAAGDLVGLSNDHPISFTWNAADLGLWATTDPSGITGGTTIAADMLEGGTRMQCSSCHDVHNANSVAGLLVKDNTGSALCLTCHKK